MALASYSDLVSAVERWLDREDLAANVPDFIALAEEAISSDLSDCSVMQRSPAPIALAALATSFALPDDAFCLIKARVVETDDELDIRPASTIKRSSSDQPGRPCLCAQSGAGDDGTLTVEVWPAADAAYTVQCTFSAAVPALAASGQTTNFVLRRAPSLYLYGALIAAAPFLGQDARIATWRSLYSDGLGRFVSQKWDGDVRLTTDLPLPRGGGFDIQRGW